MQSEQAATQTPRRTERRRRRPTAAAALLAAAMLSAGGCVFYTDRPTFAAERTFDVTPSSTIVIDAMTDNGRIEIDRHDLDRLDITALFQSFDESRAQNVSLQIEERRDGTVTVRVDWPGGKRLNGDVAHLTILAPASTIGAVAESDNGRITISNINGPIEARTDNGRITVSDCPAAVVAESDNGRITLDRIGGVINAKSDNGRITAVLTPDNPGPVNLSTDNGAIRLYVGPAFNGELTATTNNGSLDFINDGSLNITMTERKRHANRDTLTVRAGSNDTSHEPSTLQSDNGSIRIKAMREPAHNSD